MTSHTLTPLAWSVAMALVLGAGCKPKTGRSVSVRHESSRGFVPQTQPLLPSGEGMWPWDDLGDMDDRDLMARGLDMRLDEIWSAGQGGLASAVVGLEGCSASFVSAGGLMLTNHHCAYGAIQRNSTDEKNLLETGFVAGSRAEEMDGHGIKAFVFIRQTDVTVDVEADMPPQMTDLDRARYVEKKTKQIVARCEEQPDTRCDVSRVNDGLRYVLIEKLELRDVRLVAAPPESLGSFGGEVDNWHWPRHSLDFALLRAYVSPDGKPAAFAPDNVPYRPARWIEVSKDGVDEGDLVMVLGTPYSTSRYLTAQAVREDLEWYYPSRVDLFSRWTGVLEGTCRDVPGSCLATKGDLRSLYNGLSNARGMIEGLERTGLVEAKKLEQDEWAGWVEADPGRAAAWGSTLADLDQFLLTRQAGRDRDLLLRYMLRGSKLLGQAREITKWATEREKADADREPGYQDRDRDDMVARCARVQKSIHIQAEKRVLVMFLERVGTLPEGERPAALTAALPGGFGEESLSRYVDGLLAGTELADEARRMSLLDSPLEALQASTDTMIQLALALAPELDAWQDRIKEREGGLARLRPPYLESVIEFRGEAFYPDADASPRISFATVAGYAPADGMWYAPFTTMSGLVAKNTGEEPFDAPQAMLEAIRKGDAGRWVDPTLGDVPLCFMSNADTTGGNSGSPALDGEGRLVGLNFDRVWENVAGDYGYDPAMSRNIMVDVRAILFYLDLVLGAQHILNEILLVPQEPVSH